MPVVNHVNALGLAREFARRFAETRPPAQFRVTLFGSRARNDADKESDLDLFIEVEGDDPHGVVKSAARTVAADMTLEHGTVVCVFVADRHYMESHRGWSLLEAVAEEGIRIEP